MVFNRYGGFGEEVNPTQQMARRSLEAAAQYGCARGQPVAFMQIYAKAVELGVAPPNLSPQEVCALFGQNLAGAPADEAKRTALFTSALKACLTGDAVAVRTLLTQAQAAGYVPASVTDFCAALAPTQTIQDTSKPDMALVRREQERVLRQRLPSISTEDLKGIIAAIDAGTGYKDTTRPESIAPFRALFVEELQKRTGGIGQSSTPIEATPVTPGETTPVTPPAATTPPAASNTLLYVGVAAAAAFFLFRRK